MKIKKFWANTLSDEDVRAKLEAIGIAASFLSSEPAVIDWEAALDELDKDADEIGTTTNLW